MLALLGLAFLLLLAGLEIDFDRLRGRVLRLTAVAFLVSFGLALAVGVALRAGGLVRSPLLIAVILSATSLGVILPILKDAGQVSTAFGQVVVAGASIAEVAPILLLWLFFSEKSAGITSQLILLLAFLAFLAFVVVVGAAIFGLERSRRISRTLLALQDTTAEIRVRGGFLLLVLFAALASKFGLEVILGAFLAGATLKLVDRHHPPRRARGPGCPLPPARRASGPARRRRAVAGDVAEHPRGCRPDRRRPRPHPAREYVALVAAGLLSVILFPLIALALLRGGSGPLLTPPPRTPA